MQLSRTYLQGHLGSSPERALHAADAEAVNDVLREPERHALRDSKGQAVVKQAPEVHVHGLACKQGGGVGKR